MADLLRAAAPRLLIMAALAGFFVWHLGSQRPRARPVRAALFAVIALDLLSASVAQNPTLDVALFERPAWAAEVSGRPEDRVFISAGGNLVYDPVPNVYTVEVPPSISTATLSTVYDAAFPSRPIAFGLGTPIDVGPTALRLEKYQRLVNRYDVATPEARLRFLERAGVRYYVVPESPAADAREVARIPDFDGTMALYERPVRSPRVEVVPGYRVVADEDDRIGELFSSRVDPSSTVLLAGEPPPAAGAAAEGRERAAEIVAETPNAVTVRADVPEGGGFLVLRDAYDPNWRAEVDGREVPVVRADVVFRAVRLEPGEHTVALRYAPRPMLVGAVISAAALAAILAMAAFGRRGQNVNRAAS